MNTMYFQDLVKGEYGRKVAYADYDTVTLENAVDIVSRGVTTLNINRPAIKYLWGYYKGDQPIRYRTKVVREEICNKIVENHAFEIVQFKVAQSYGEPIQCISRTDDEKINSAVDKLNTYLADAFKNVRDIACGEWQSAVGYGFEAVNDLKDDNADVPFRIIVPDPLNTIVVYSSITFEPLLALQNMKTSRGENYYQCYSKTHQFKVQNAKIVDGSWSLHTYGEIPIVEKMNNSNRISDIELVIDLLDAINNMQSSRMDGIEQFIQAFMKFVNCEIDQETYDAMRATGAFMVKSNNGENKADVDLIEQELNQEQSQVAKEDLLDNVFSISGIPNKEGGTKSGDSQGAVELRAGWDFAKNRAKLKDPFIVESEKRLLTSVLNIVRIRKGKNDIPLKATDFTVQVSHNPTDNLIIRAQALQYLLQCGINPVIALKTCGLFADVEKVFKLSKPYLDNLWKTVDMVAEEQKATQLLEQFNNSDNKATT